MLTLLVGFALLVVSLSARFDPYRSLSKSTGAAGSMPGGSTRPPSVTPRRADADAALVCARCGHDLR